METRSKVIGVVVFLTVFFLVLVAGAGAVEIKGIKVPPCQEKQALMSLLPRVLTSRFTM